MMTQGRLSPPVNVQYTDKYMNMMKLSMGDMGKSTWLQFIWNFPAIFFSVSLGSNLMFHQLFL